jgi:hypothetical protein
MYRSNRAACPLCEAPQLTVQTREVNHVDFKKAENLVKTFTAGSDDILSRFLPGRAVGKLVRVFELLLDLLPKMPRYLFQLHKFRGHSRRLLRQRQFLRPLLRGRLPALLRRVAMGGQSGGLSNDTSVTAAVDDHLFSVHQRSIRTEC